MHVHVHDSVLPEAGSTANLMFDAHLAALAIEHGLTLSPTEGDSVRFLGLCRENLGTVWEAGGRPAGQDGQPRNQ